MSISKFPSFQDMEIWQKAMNLSVEVFNLSLNLPKCEDYGLTSQIRRSAASVHTNIAEGYGRVTAPDKNRFYSFARGSATETQSHLIYGNNVGYFNNDSILVLLEKYNEVLHDLNKLKKALNNKQG